MDFHGIDYFLSSFTSGKSLLASFWKARHKLCVPETGANKSKSGSATRDKLKGEQRV
ncbi:hypothetical protein NIES4071_75500 [Calothrix sp. NIES-4071]|nr:hypothetical protein NIES4071_75500 [Calothrix sp. NIES-4071]BAZ61825.1 hypothetical protein NIES4105_75450 [Calothrix sp. NIES-4105]